MSLGGQTYKKFKDLDLTEKSYVQSANLFFKKNKYLNMLLEIVNPQNNHRISLRALEWFVTNYCKKNGTYYLVKQHGNVSIFTVYTDYKAKLKAFKKEYFDPFCRGVNIHFNYSLPEKGKFSLLTSIAQLNFFQWAIKYKIIEYVHKHINDIEKDMKIPRSDHLEKQLSDDESDEDFCIDNEICSSESIKHVNLSHNSDSKTHKKKKRHELSTSIYKTIKKIDSPPKLYFN